MADPQNIGTPQVDYAQQILQPLQVEDSVKADAWDAYNGASSLDDFTKRISSLNIPQEAKANLWDKANERFSQGVTEASPAATTAATTPPETNPQEPSMWSAITNSPAANYIKKKYGQLTEWGGGKGAELATQPVKALTAAENPNLAEAGLPMLSMNRTPEQNAMIRTDEQLTSLAQQKHPYAMGVATGIGKTMGGMAVDPLQWAMTLSGIEALPILHKVITGAFAAKAGYDTITGANQLAKDWDKLTPNERAERLTSLGLTGAMTVAAASHMSKGVTAGDISRGVDRLGDLARDTEGANIGQKVPVSPIKQSRGLGRIPVEPHEPRAKTGEALGEIQRPANKPSVMGTAYTPVAPNVPTATGEPRFGGGTNPTPKVTVAGTAYTPVEPKVTPTTAEPKFGGGTNPAPKGRVNLAVPPEVTARPFTSIGGPIDVNVPKTEAVKPITPEEVKSTPGTSMGPKVTIGGKEVPKAEAKVAEESKIEAKPAEETKGPHQDITPEQFREALDKNSMAATLTDKTPDQMRQHQIHQMTGKDGKPIDAYYAISPEGDLQGVVNNSSERGLLDKIMPEAIKNGAKTLDAWDVNGKLPSMYGKYGFEKVSHSPYDVEQFGEPSDALKDAWRKAGWKDGDPYPGVTYMKLGEKAAGAKPDTTLDQVKAEMPNAKPSEQFAEASRRAQDQEKGIAGETKTEDIDRVKQHVTELSNLNLKKLGAALGLDPDAYNFANRVVPEGRSQKVPVERVQMVDDAMAKLSPEQVHQIAEQSRAVKGEPKVGIEPDRSFKSRAEEAESILKSLWEGKEKPAEVSAAEPAPAAKAEEKPVAEEKAASPKIETKFTGGDKQYEGKSNKGKAMKAYAAKKAAEAANETGKGLPEIKDNILDQLEKAPKDDNGKPTVVGKGSLANAVGATADETEQALRELQKEGKIDAHVGRQGGEPAETVYAAALKSAETAKGEPAAAEVVPKAEATEAGGGKPAPKLKVVGDQAHFDVKENGAENNRDAQAQIEAAARAAKEQGLTALYSANDPAWFYAWSKFGKDHGLTPLDHTGDGYAWDLKDFEPEKQFEGKRPGPEATTATAKMTPEEAQAAGFTKEQVEAGVNLPKAGGGAEGEIPARKLSGMSRIPEKIAKQFTDEEIAGLKTPKSQQKAADVLKTLPKFQEWVDIANLGAGERKWYQRGTAAIKQIADLLPQWFDKTKNDVDRFLNLLAAYSPQQPIDRNFTEALGIWKELKTAEKNGVDLNSPAESPRPDKLRKDIEWTKAAELMWDNTSMYRGAKVPNAMMGWTGKTALEMWPDLTKNNAFKVPSFAANLAGFLRKVTNDGWMGAFSGISGDDLSDPQHYHPISVMARAAAEELGWEPAEAQAAVWAAVKTLTEEGTATPEGIRKYAQDFADLAQHDPQMRDMLSKMGIDLKELDDRLQSSAIPERPEVASRGTPSTEDSVRKLTDRLRKSGRQGIKDLSPEDQDRIRELSGKPKANQTPAEKALGKAMKDEGDTSFNTEDFEVRPLSKEKKKATK